MALIVEIEFNMKSMFVRAGSGLLCAAVLSACGGGDGNGNLLLGGSVQGLSKPGLVLQNGDQTTEVAAGASSFYFPSLIAPDASFDVKIKTDATASKCEVVNGSGKANYYNTQQVVVRCTTDSYQLGGTVSGLTADGLVLANGASTAGVVKGSSSFLFTTPVFDGANYGVTILAQPAGLVCSVANGTGTMPSGNVLTVAVSCQPAA